MSVKPILSWFSCIFFLSLFITLFQNVVIEWNSTENKNLLENRSVRYNVMKHVTLIIEIIFIDIAIKCWENVRTINHLFHIGNSSLTGRISGEMKRNSNGSYRGFIFMLCYYQLNADNQIELSSYFTHWTSQKQTFGSWFSGGWFHTNTNIRTIVFRISVSCWKPL